jgi:hypothetical protein
MAAPRLSEEQKTALVERYRSGGAAADLAVSFGCSAATVTRVVKAALSPDEYEQLKQGRGRGGSRPAASNAAADDTEPVPAVASVGLGAGPDAPAIADPTVADEPGNDEAGEDEPHGVLAIDDADDFGDDADADTDAEPDGDGDGDEDAFVAVPVLPLAAVGQELVECRPLEQASLPASAYMLVDKTVELEARPLKEFPELGPLPPEEQEHRALQMFANPRQAKQLCGRSQRVIKIPDPLLLHRTARYLVAQGITRVVLEGSVYSLPGS